MEFVPTALCWSCPQPLTGWDQQVLLQLCACIAQNPCARTALLHHPCPINTAFPRIPRLFKLKMFFGSLFQQE